MICYKCKRDIPDNSLVCTYCGAEMSRRFGFGNPTGFGFGSYGGTLPMTWFKFIIYFMLFFDAIGSLGNAFLYGTGAIARLSLGEEVAVYSFSYLGINYRIIDIIYGALCALCAVFAIYTRFSLAKYKRFAPTLYIIYLAASPALNILYNFAFYYVTKAEPAYYFTLFTTALWQGVYIYFNYIYFRKRKHLFEGR